MLNTSFRIMAFMFEIRDLLAPRKNVLKEIKIEPGFKILDFGCGPGSYSVIAARMVEPNGKIYALDIHPMAIQTVQKKARRKGLSNIEIILSERATGLDENAVDVVLLFDVFHELSETEAVLTELNRVLKPDGILAFSDHHLSENEVLSRVTGSGHFELIRRNKKTYSFRKVV